ncbi:MAG: lipoyl(octanoyl) transferase LipB, partial [Planctomycetota bacterium]
PVPDAPATPADIPPPIHPLLPVRDLGVVGYEEAFDEQRATHARVLAQRDTPSTPLGELLLLEHPPVITLSKRASAADHLLASREILEQHGVALHETDRGGDITYHGPGQLVAYPVLDLNRLKLGLHDYMRALEEIVIDTCTDFGVPAQRDPDATGVWTTHNPSAKLCAMGIRVRRWVSMHGFALNNTTNLDHFALIVPCGLAGRPVTSLERETGGGQPDMPTLKAGVAERFRAWIAGRVET